MKIALSGPMFAGKTTLATTLRDEYGWTMLDYTGTLKHRLAMALTAATGTQVTVTHIVDNKTYYRKLLQVLGDVLGYSEGYGIRELLENWRANGDTEVPVVFDNVRFEKQADMLREEGFVIVGMELGGAEQQARAHAHGIDAKKLREMQGHDAEDGVTADIYLEASGTTFDMAETLGRLAGPVRKQRPAVVDYKAFAANLVSTNGGIVDYYGMN